MKRKLSILALVLTGFALGAATCGVQDASAGPTPSGNAPGKFYQKELQVNGTTVECIAWSDEKHGSGLSCDWR